MDNTETKFVIAPKNLPTKMPLQFSVLAWLAMDYYAAPGWVYGAVGLFLIVLWVAFFYSLVGRKTIDIFKGDSYRSR